MENINLDLADSSKNLTNIEVLLIDSSESNRFRTAQLFKKFFLEVYEAKNFIEALDILENKDISYLVLNSKGTNTDPIDFIHKFRSKNTLVPITVFSDDDSPRELMKYANADIQGYIVNPLDYEKLTILFSKISHYIKKHFHNSDYLLENYYYNYEKKLLLNENKKAYKLNNKETKLLHLLIKNKNETVRFEDFEKEVWGSEDVKMTSSALRTVIKNLRKKTGLKNIENLSRIGYKLII